MQPKLSWKVIFIVALVAFAVLRVWPPEQKLQGGLDLVGGYSLTYRVDLAGDKERKLYISGLRELAGIPSRAESTDADKAAIQNLHAELSPALGEEDQKTREDELDAKAADMAAAKVAPVKDLKALYASLTALEALGKDPATRDKYNLTLKSMGLESQRAGIEKVFGMPEGTDEQKADKQKALKTFVDDLIEPAKEPLKRQLEELSRNYRDWQRLLSRQNEFGNPADVLNQLISILRNRVDPDGTRNTVWKPLPPDRITIEMSRAPEAVTERLNEFEQALESLDSVNVDLTDLDAMLKMPPAVREMRLDEYLKTHKASRARLNELFKLYDCWQAVLAMEDQIKAVGATSRPAGAAEVSLKEIQEFSKLEAGPQKDARRKAFLDAFPPARREAATAALAGYEKVLADPTLPRNLAPAKDAFDNAFDGLNLSPAAVRQALQADDKNLSEVLENPNDPKSKHLTYRQLAIKELRAKYPVRAEMAASEVVTQVQKDPQTEQARQQMKILDYVAFCWSQYERVKGPLSDPTDLQRLLRGAGELRFAITVARGDPLTDENTMREMLIRRGLEAANDYNPSYRWYKVRRSESSGVKDFEFTDGGGQVRYIRVNIGGVPKTYKDSNKVMMDGPRVLDYTGGTDYILCYNTQDKKLDNSKPRAWKLTKARATTDERGLPAIGFTFDQVGASYFGELTGNNKDKLMAVILDGEIYSAPQIRARITTDGIITGRFSKEEQDRLIRTLISGMLPGRLVQEPVSQRLISANIGVDNVRHSLMAGLIALAMVTAFMIVYYMITGVIADLALLMNILFVLASMVAFGATFTLAGVAGVILTIGMAVDANILINERIREELSGGRTSLRLAVRNAYDRVLRTIVDANLTTLLTALVLLWVGNDEVKGFGITLTLGLLLNMFTALFVTRVVLLMVTAEKGELRRMLDWKPAEIGPPLLLVALVGLIIWWMDPNGIWAMLAFFALIVAQLIAGAVIVWVLRLLRRTFAVRLKNPLPMLELIKNARIDWVKKKTVFWIISSVLVLASLFAFTMRGILSDDVYGIEFRPGVLIQMDLQRPMSVSEARDRVQQQGNEMIPAAPALGRALATANVVGVGDTATTGGFSYLRFEVQVSTQRRESTAKFSADLWPDEGTGGGQQVDEVAKALIKAFELSPARDGARYDQLKGELKDNTWLARQKPVSVVPTDENFTSAGGTGIDYDVQLPANWRITPEMAEASVKYRPFVGGVRLFYDQLTPALTLGELQKRLDAYTQKEDLLTDFPDLRQNLEFALFSPGVTDEKTPVTRFEVAATWHGAQLQGPRRISFLRGMNHVIVSALAREEAFPMQQSVDPYIAGDAQRKAWIAIVLSMVAIIAYIWVRFGRVTYGLAAVLALVHDVIISLGMVCMAGWVVQLTNSQPLLLNDFKVDLAMVAALLTIIGYSLNDTIVVFDRIRENRGRLGEHSPAVINASINQMLGRTIWTSATTFMVVLVMYIWGGEAIRAFNFAIMIGVIVGTYSSIAIASPLLLGLRGLADKMGYRHGYRPGKQAPSLKTQRRREQALAAGQEAAEAEPFDESAEE